MMTSAALLRKRLTLSASCCGKVFVPGLGRSPAPARAARVGRRFFGQSAPPKEAELADHAPAWDDLRAKLESLQTPEEQTFRKDLAEGHGPPNAMANLRVFDQDEAAAKKVTLYRDSASWCPYCQKVWMLLEEKQIPYSVKRINMNCYGDKPNSFLDMQPNGCIPVAEMGGRVLRSSNEIIENLLQTPGPLPSFDQAVDPFDDPRSTELLRIDRQLGGGWLEWLRGGGSGTFKRSLQQMEDALSADESGPYFLGERFSLIDIMYTPYFERAVASLAYYKGFNIRDRERYPAINAWLDAMDSRPSVRASKGDYYTHAHDLPPQIGGCGSEGGGAAAREMVDGGAWKLPLRTDMIEPDWGWVSPAEARREAAERLSHNAPNVARFAARGASAPGFPPVWAELADPNASPAEYWLPALDVLLRHTSALLVTGDPEEADADKGDARAEAWAAAQKSMASLSYDSRCELAKCLEYLQRRIGVPRDMSLPAARRLRAELGKLVGALRQ